MAYKTPTIYRVVHFILGVIDFPTVPFLIYQGAQLLLGVRVFAFSVEVKRGNNLTHTLLKCVDFGMGKAVFYILSRQQ